MASMKEQAKPINVSLITLVPVLLAWSLIGMMCPRPAATIDEGMLLLWPSWIGTDENRDESILYPVLCNINIVQNSHPYWLACSQHCTGPPRPVRIDKQVAR